MSKIGRADRVGEASQARFKHDPNQQDRLMSGLRAFGANYADFTRRFAASLGLHATDAVALAEILYAEDKDEPLSPAKLSKLLPLSPAATTALLNRLEAAGYVARTREHQDRRLVTIRSSGEIHAPASAFFTPLANAIDEMLVSYPTAFLSDVEAFLHQLRATMTAVRHEAHSRENSTVDSSET